MIGNLSKVDQRLKTYVAVPDKRFEVKSGLSPHEEAVKQRVRQYWADGSIPDAKKLQGLNIDLRGFDPRHTTVKELRSLGVMLADLGLIDNDLIGAVSSIDVEFDSQGNEIETNKTVDAYAFIQKNLEFLKKHISSGNDYAKSALVDLNTAASVLMALERFGNTPKIPSLVNIRV